MASVDWRSFLKHWSEEIIASGDYVGVTPAMIQAGWLGYDGASETALAEFEARLGKALPKSYRQFLQVSNGWRYLTPFVQHIFAIDEVDWLNNLNPDVVENFQMGLDLIDDLSQATDDDFPELHIIDTLQISAEHDSAFLLLNPNKVTEDGEWEAWFFARWNTGADIYPSFAALMMAQYDTFRELTRQEKLRFNVRQDLRPQLANLSEFLNERLRHFNKLAEIDFGVSSTARAVIHDVMLAVEEIRNNAPSSDDALAMLRALQVELAQKAKYKPPHVDTTEMLSVLGRQNPQEMLDQIAKLAPDIQAHGRLQGLAQSESLIRWFLRE